MVHQIIVNTKEVPNVENLETKKALIQKRQKTNSKMTKVKPTLSYIKGKLTKHSNQKVESSKMD